MRLLAITTAALVAAVVVFVAFTLPAAPLATGGLIDAAVAARTIRGAFHVHSTDSDGRADRAAIAAAARRAALQFVILTDHGDGTSPQRDAVYVGGVLVVNGVEISTNAGHYLAVGLGSVPYRLGGDASDVAEDVRRLGGVGIIAHPDSAKLALAWHDWNVQADGLEWLNGDSEWRNESRLRLGSLFLHYFLRPAPALAEMLDRSADVSGRWAESTTRYPLTAIAGHDAHGGLGGFAEGGRSTSGVPSYEALFRAFSTHAILADPPSGDARRDATALVEALRRGRVYTVIDGLGTPGGLDFRARRAGNAAEMGDSLTGGGAVAFSAKLAAPPGTRVSLIRNGREVASAIGDVLTTDASEPGAYHVEATLAGPPNQVPWILGNPIYVDLPPPATPPVPPAPARAVSLMEGEWRVEKDPASQASLAAGPAVTFHLREGDEASQFVALVAPVPDSTAFDSVLLNLAADQPMRVSVQLRTGDGKGRWRRSVYVPPDGRQIAVSLASFVPAEAGIPARVEASLIKSLLLVIDLTNAVPGTRGTIRARRVDLTSQD